MKKIFYIGLIANLFLLQLHAQTDFWYQINSPTHDTSITSIGSLANNQIFVGTTQTTFRSTDNGISWSRFNGPCSGFRLFGSGIIFGADDIYYSPLWKSIDGGLNWRKIDTLHFASSSGQHDVDLAIVSDSIIYMLTNSADYMYHYYGFIISHSQDTAKSFVRDYYEYNSPSNCSCPMAWGYRILNVGKILLVATSKGVLRSIDGGSNWEYSNTGFPDVPLGSGNPGKSVIRIVVDSFGDVYSLLSYGAGGVYLSNDTGRSWQATGGGLPSGNSLTDLKLNSSGSLYVSSASGIYFARSPHDYWAPLNSGLGDSAVSSLGIDNTGNLLAGTSKGNLFRSYEPANDVIAVNTFRSFPYTLAQNYPNPFNPTTTIEYEVPRQSHIRISLYDLLGRELVKLVDEMKQAGRYSIVWNAAKHTSGIYFCRISADGFITTKKMILAK